MIEIEEMPDRAFVTLKLSGIVTRADVDASLPRLELAFGEQARLRLYVELVGLDRFETAGLWEELKFQLRYRDRIERVAFIVASPGEAWAGWLAQQLAEGECRRFGLGEEAQAVTWLLEAG